MQQVSELTVSYKPKVKAADRYSIHYPQDAYKLLMEQAFNDDTLEYKEYFKLVLLNGANKVLGITTISEKIKEAAKLMDIRIQDHLIVTGDNYYSYADEGRL